MMDWPRFRRTHAIAALHGAFLTALLTACVAQPTGQPDTVPPPTALPPRTPALTDPELTAQAGAIPELENTSLFADALAALASGDWMAASLALPTPAGEHEPGSQATADVTSQADIRLWIAYLELRIALLRGDTELHARLLAELMSQTLPSGLERELLRHQLVLAQGRNDPVAELRIAAALSAAGSHPQFTAPMLNAAVWRASQRLSTQQADALSNDAAPLVQGWLALTQALKIDDASSAASELRAWQTQFPGHPGSARAAQLANAAERDAATEKITLLLPLSGPLQAAGDAVSRGFIAAYFADRLQGVSIEILDSRRLGEISAAYDTVAATQTDVIVGPLAKLQVEALLQLPARDIPLLTLNRPLNAAVTSNAALLMSLAPEDEAESLASAAFARGHRRALVIRPEGEWGDRMQNALQQRWGSLGGRLPALANYTDSASYSGAISAALDLDASAERSRTLRTLFNERIESSGRRRADLDAIFLLARSSEEARALKPLIDYHYAGDLEVFALSTADSYSNDNALNRDLDGLQLLAMPWRLAGPGLPGIATEDDRDGFVALHALGVDAYSLARRWWRLYSDSEAQFSGQTAVLANSPAGTLIRNLPLAEFDRGALVVP